MDLGTLHVLVDNRAMDASLGFEHGWSVLVDLGPGRRWLWDTGQTGLFLENARTMGVSPLDADGLALSHGHHDHAGGLPSLLAAGYGGPIVGHPEMLAIRYSRRDGTTFRSIGMGDGRLALPLAGFEPVADIRELAPGLTFVTGIPRRPGAFAATAHLYRDTAGAVADTVPDDACLVIEGDRGPVLLLGCCHSGLGNTLVHLRERLGLTSVEAVIGGLHLTGAPDWAVEETLASLADFGARRLLAGHCTGQPALARLARDFSGQTAETGAGMRIVI
jgi:7,8-dihydropterin-6-yl-methyl-4-(beta-D-ribofuranosyl)aminobenzene 5'-phosphate synthase